MTATFGRLDHQSLTLNPGLNILFYPNEGGKSTWAEFILAMLYGVSTGERKKAGVLPLKERCLPWSGQAVEGSMTLVTDDDQTITLERTSTPKTPMARFRAYHTHTGQPLSHLTDKTCGQQLLGADRSVYERSGFIRQGSIPVTKDAALEQRLGALVTGGDEDYAYSTLARQLRDRQNRCRHNKTGLIPEAQAQLEQIQAQLRQISTLRQTVSTLQAQLADAQARQLQLLQAQKAQQAQTRQARLAAAQEKARQAQADAVAAADACQGLPEQAQLLRLRQQLEQLSRQQQAAALDAALIPPEPAPPAPPQGFAGLTPDQAASQTQADKMAYASCAAAVSPPGPGLLIAAALLLAAALAVGLLLHPAGFALALPAGALALAHLHRRRRAQASARHQQESAQSILAKYAVSDVGELDALVADYRQRMEAYQAQTQQIAKGQEACRQTIHALTQQQQALAQQVHAFAPGQEPQQAITAALERYHQRDMALREARSAQDTLSALEQALGPAPEDLPAGLPVPEDLPEALASCNQKLLSTRSRLDEARGRLSALPDPLVLTAQKEQLENRLSQLEMEYTGLTLALSALERADQELRSRFSPLLCRRAGEIFARLTGGRYDKLLLDRELSVAARPTGEAVMRPSQALSQGTADQLYLALRLAMSELLLPNVPLVLDDALAAMDDHRAALALETLEEMAKTRQILLFTCHTREQRLLAQGQEIS